MKKRTQSFETRQNLKNDEFEIFHYRDTNPHSVPIHHHDFYEIYLFLEGKVCFRVEGKNYPLEPGDILLINPKEMHQVDTTANHIYERIVLWINRSFLEKLCGEENLKACFEEKAENIIRPDTASSIRLLDLAEKLWAEFYGNGFGKTIYTKGLFYQIIAEINRLAKSSDKHEHILSKDLTGDVVAYINEHYSDNLTLDLLAKEFFVSKYHLSHEFTRQYRTSVYRYIILKRLLVARGMINEGQKPSEVYKPCGFGDYTTFYRAFKLEYGISPKEFANNR